MDMKGATMIFAGGAFVLMLALLLIGSGYSDDAVVSDSGASVSSDSGGSPGGDSGSGAGDGGGAPSGDSGSPGGDSGSASPSSDSGAPSSDASPASDASSSSGDSGEPSPSSDSVATDSESMTTDSPSDIIEAQPGETETAPEGETEAISEEASPEEEVAEEAPAAEETAPTESITASSGESEPGEESAPAEDQAAEETAPAEEIAAETPAAGETAPSEAAEEAAPEEEIAALEAPVEETPEEAAELPEAKTEPVCGLEASDTGAANSGIECGVEEESVEDKELGENHNNAVIAPTSVLENTDVSFTATFTNGGPRKIWKVEADRESGSEWGSATSVSCPAGWTAGDSGSSATCTADSDGDWLEVGEIIEMTFNSGSPSADSCTNSNWELTSRFVGDGNDVHTTRPVEVCPPVASLTSVAPITIVATKIVCNAESDLPNWGAGGPDVTATTASDFLAAHPDCVLESGWNFQWAYGAANPGDNTGAALGWNTFGPTDASGIASADVISQAGTLWVREVWQEGYIPFTGQNTNQPVSAEIYCAIDVLNYDNYERVDNAVGGNTYYCVAFNVPTTGTLTVNKVVVNDNGGTAEVDSFPLYVGSTSVASGAANEFDPGTYTVSEDGLSSYAATFSGDCDSNGTVTLAAGEDKICTITNDDLPGTVTVFKHVVNDNGGTAIASAFTIYMSSNDALILNFPGDENGTTLQLNAGDYGFSEGGSVGYNVSYSEGCRGSIANGESLICTITNDDIAQPELFARACGAQTDLCTWDVELPYGSQDVSSCNLQYNTEWSINTDATATCTFDGSQYAGHNFYFSVDNDVVNCTLNGVPIVQNFLHGGCALQDPRDGQNISITPLAGTNTIICTVHDYGVQTFFDACVVGEGNPHGMLTVTKNVINDNGGSAVASDFTMNVSGNNPTQGEFPGNESGTTILIGVGAYSVSELPLSGYEATYSTDCNSTIANGEEKRCVVTNDDIAPPVCDPQLELISNGGFESPEVTHGTKWDIFMNGTTGMEWAVAWMSPPGTTFGSYTIPEIASLEFHENVIGTAYEGDQYAELDGDWNGHAAGPEGEQGSTKISQAIATAPGEEYTLSFAYSPRTAGAADNVLEVRANGVLIGTESRAGTGSTSWTNHSYAFTADSSTTVIEFSDAGTRNSLGTLLDDVSLLCSPAPPQAQLTVTKIVINDNGGTANVSNFPLYVGQTPVASGAQNAFPTGTHSVSETGGSGAVDLGTAGDFAILAKSGISTTGTTSIVGDIGVSPIDSTAMSGFGLVMDFSNQFATSSLVTGKAYAANYAPPTPAKMTTAVSDMETAYTDAAGRAPTYPDDLYGGDITGQTLAPGVYKWGTNVLVNNPGVTLSGGPSDVWIFQIAQNLEVGNDAIITLSGGAQPQNIFWQVAGQATLGTTSDVKGIILSQTAIVMNNGAKLNGRALAQTAVTMIADTVTEPIGAPVPQQGYTSSFSGDCDANGSVTLNEGDNKSCTITNDDVRQLFARPCGIQADLCNWDYTLPFGSQDASSCNLQYNTEWPLNTLQTATCTFDGSQYAGHNFYLSIDNDVVNCTLNGVPFVQNFVHEGCALQDPRSLQLSTNGTPNSFALSPIAGTNTIVCTVRDRGTQTFFDACVVGNGSPTGTLTVTKVVINNNGGAANVSDFPLYVGQTSVTSGAENEFGPGTYAVSEDGFESYTATFSGDCDENGSVTLNNGDNKSCTITNDDLPGYLEVLKHVINDNGGTANASDFLMLVNGTNVSHSSFPGSENVFIVSLDAGSYSVSEADQSGYQATYSIDCTGSIRNGESKLCVVTNDDIPSPMTCINFENLSTGSSVEGLGTIDPLLNIDSRDANSPAVVIAQGVNPTRYTAPNGIPSPIKNACLGNPGRYALDGNVSVAGKAFSETDTDNVMNYTFTFASGVTMDKFSIDMRDFGDYNPFSKKFHKVVLTAYDAANSTVGTSVLSFNRTTTSSQTSPQYGNLLLTGDACTANATNNVAPGNWNFAVEGSGIVRVELTFAAGLDPNTALDNLCYRQGETIIRNGTITVYKVVVNNDTGNKTVGDFPLYVDQTGVTSGQSNTFTPGTYAVSESQLEGYTSSFSGDCNENGTLALGEGENRNCTITNDDIPRQPLTCSCIGGEGDIYADCVDSYSQGKRKDGTPVVPARSNANASLHANQTSGQQFDVPNPAETTFFATGFGGNITLCFNNEVENRPGNDLHIFETTYGPGTTYPPEKAMIEGSADGYNYVLLSPSITRDSDVDLDIGPLPTLRFIRISDISNKSLSGFDSAADAYDVDAVAEIPYAEQGEARLSVQLTEPANPTEVQQGQLFTATANVSCDSGVCGDVNVTLDPPVRLLVYNPNSPGPLGGAACRGSYGVLPYSYLEANGVVVDYWCNSNVVDASVLANYDALYIGRSRTNFGYPVSYIDSSDLRAWVQNGGGVILESNGDNWEPSTTTNIWPSIYDILGYNNCPSIEMSDNAGGFSISQAAPHPIWDGITTPISGYGLYEGELYDSCVGTGSIIGSSGAGAQNPMVNEFGSGRTYSGPLFDYPSSGTDAEKYFLNIVNWVAGGSSKGAIPMNSGTPFYTTSSNPAMPSDFPCLAGMAAGNSCIVSWSVNPTGMGTWELFAIANSSSGANNESNRANVTIISRAKLTVYKVVVNDNGGSATVGDFPLYVDQAQVTSGEENEFESGTYTVSESGSEAYGAAFSGDCDSEGSVTLAAGESKTCTITNDDLPGTLIVYKHVINDNGGTLTASDFNMTVSGTGASLPEFPGDESGTAVALDAGAFSADELAQAGYTKSFSQECYIDEETEEQICTSTCSGTIGVGETLYCTITNDDQRAMLTVNKVVINNDGKLEVASHFQLLVNGSSVTSGVQNALDAGAYLVSEVPDEGYTASFSGDCDANGNIALAPGDSKTCTITNDDISSPNNGGGGNSNGGGNTFIPAQSFNGGGEPEGLSLELSGGSNNTTNVTEPPVLALAPIRRAPLQIPEPNAGNVTSAPLAAALFGIEWESLLPLLLMLVGLALAALFLLLLLMRRKKGKE